MESIRSLQQALIALDDARHAAMTRADIPALEPLLSDELSYTHSTGTVETKTQYLAALACGRVRYCAIQRDLDRISAFDGCVVMQGRLAVQAEVEGRNIVASTVFTSTWVRRDTGWQMAAWAATAMPHRPCHS